MRALPEHDRARAGRPRGDRGGHAGAAAHTTARSTCGWARTASRPRCPRGRRSRSAARAASATAATSRSCSCAGAMLTEALVAADLLRRATASPPRVSTSAPSSRSTPRRVVAAAAGVGAVVTVEEHTVARRLRQRRGRGAGRGRRAAPACAGIGMPDAFAHAVGSRDHLIRHYGLDAGGRSPRPPARLPAAPPRGRQHERRRHRTRRGPSAPRRCCDEFAFLKSTDSARGAARPLDRRCRGGGALRAGVRAARRRRAADRRPGRWRRAAQFAFPTRFPVSDEGTATLAARRPARRRRPHALPGLRPPRPRRRPSRLRQRRGRRRLDGDRQRRPRRARAAPGLMGEALDALIAWAEELFAPERILLHVFEDNGHAIGFYRRHGFHGARPRPAGADGGRRPRGRSSRPAAGESDAAFLVMERHAPAEAPAGEQILTAGPSCRPASRATRWTPPAPAGTRGGRATSTGSSRRSPSTSARSTRSPRRAAPARCTWPLPARASGPATR